MSDDRRHDSEYKQWNVGKTEEPANLIVAKLFRGYSIHSSIAELHGFRAGHNALALYATGFRGISIFALLRKE